MSGYFDKGIARGQADHAAIRRQLDIIGPGAEKVAVVHANRANACFSGKF